MTNSGIFNNNYYIINILIIKKENNIAFYYTLRFLFVALAYLPPTAQLAS